MGASVMRNEQKDKFQLILQEFATDLILGGMDSLRKDICMIHIRFTLTQTAAVLLLGLGLRTASASEETVSIQPPVVAAALSVHDADSTAPETVAGREWLRDVGHAPPLSAPAPQFYVAGIVGNSFATLTNSGSYQFNPGDFIGSSGACSDSLLTGGGALGLALHRSSGQLRLEIEGRARGVLTGETALDVSLGPTTVIPQPATATATDAWSVMSNLWRDWTVTKSVGVYGGGGIGFGGYRYAASTDSNAFFPANTSGNVNTFAWQVGTGVTWAASDRISLDLGYRFFSYGNGQTPLVETTSPPATFYGNATSAFTASELLFTVRIYEPFRGLVR